MIKVFEFNIDGRTIYAAYDFKGSLPMPTKQGYFLTDSELEQFARKAFEAARKSYYGNHEVCISRCCDCYQDEDWKFETFEDFKKLILKQFGVE